MLLPLRALEDVLQVGLPYTTRQCFQAFVGCHMSCVSTGHFLIGLLCLPK